MIEAWKKQFTLKQLSLVHDKPITFIISQWQREPKPSILYLVYRWVVALIFFISLVISIVDLKHPNASSAFRAKWLIYLTNWGYTACTLQALLVAFILSTYALAPRLKSIPNLQENALKMCKFYWVINIMATDIAFGITSIYWALIYDEKTMDLDALNILMHANNSVLMMIDLFVVSHPMRLLHCCYPVLFGIVYATFSLIFYAAGGISKEGYRYIYTILKWSNPGTSLIVCLAVIGFIVIIHCIVWGLYKFRIWLHSKCFGDKLEKCDSDNIDINLSAKKYYDNDGLARDIV